MKIASFLILSFLNIATYAQVSVSTISTNFKGSGGLSLDDSGNLYIADFGDFLSMADPDGLPNHIMKLDTSLVLSQYSTGFIGASGNDFDSNGILYQSDIRNNAIYKIINGTRTLVTFTGIVSPVGIAFDSSDNFFVCNCGNNTIQKVTPTGSSTLFASGGMFSCPNGITVDEDDNLYVSNFSNSNIVKITPSGTATVIGNTPNNNGHIDYDENSRNLFIASYSGNQIFSMNLDNPVPRLIAGSGVRGNDDGDAQTSTFSTPNGIAVSKTGDSIYVNCAVPLFGSSINPQIVRLITGVTQLSSIQKSLSDFQFNIFPNPGRGEFNIDHSNQFGPIEIEVISLKSQKVYTNSFDNEEPIHFSIDVSPGIYTVKLRTELGVFVKKVNIQ